MKERNTIRKLVKLTYEELPPGHNLFKKIIDRGYRRWKSAFKSALKQIFISEKGSISNKDLNKLMNITEVDIARRKLTTDQLFQEVNEIIARLIRGWLSTIQLMLHRQGNGARLDDFLLPIVKQTDGYELWHSDMVWAKQIHPDDLLDAEKNVKLYQSFSSALRKKVDKHHPNGYIVEYFHGTHAMFIKKDENGYFAEICPGLDT